MLQLQKKIEAIKPDRFLLWAPAWLMLGIAAYFRLDFEPGPLRGALMLAASTLALALCWRFPVRWLAFTLFLAALGFVAAQVRTHIVATPLLYYQMYNRSTEGTIEEIDLVEDKIRLTLANPVVEYLPQNATPRKVRISFPDDGTSWDIGDRVRFDANLMPLPAPNMPGAFDFARHFYFRSVGAIGYAYKPPQIVADGAASGWGQRLRSLRQKIGQDMRAGMPGPAGTVAAAMTVGETGPIPEDTKAHLRDSGLAHMLAIAGLHLGIVAGVVFFVSRLLLTLVPFIALRLPVKKIAALLALASAFIYVSLAGYPIPAERAFIGAAFLFIAMLFDRRGISLRTLAIAAILILLAFPEAMFSASFQMSFSATLAIVSFYERFGRELFHRGSWWVNLIYHLIAIAIMSVIATAATAPYVLYNFNRFAAFGLIANIVVVPLATILIMPAMIASLMLMPFGLQHIGYEPLQYGVEIMLKAATWVTSLPYALVKLPGPTDAGLVACSFGLLWFCLRSGCKSLLGILLMLAGLATIAQSKPYDILISDDAGKVAIREDDELLFVRGLTTSFDAESWLRYQNANGARLDKDEEDCDELRCALDFHGKNLVVAMHKGTIKGLCDEKADILISQDLLTDPACARVPLLIDKKFLNEKGATGLRFTRKGLEIETAMKRRGTRPWTPPPQSELYVPDNSDIKDDDSKDNP